MKGFHSTNGTGLKIGLAVVVVFLLFCIAALLFGLGNSISLKARIEGSVKKIQLVQAMKSDLLASAEAEKSSVMADTDEASEAFAGQSVMASQRVEKARRELAVLVKENDREAKLLGEFSSCWGELKETDREVLSLAVQNTNLKALRLSFVPAAAAIKHMEESLDRLMDSAASSPDAAEIIRLASRALTGAFDIYVLQAPHIAETADAEMDRIEAQMKQSDDQVRNALNDLSLRAGNPERLLVGEAQKSYQEFQTINAEVIDLSRKNSNIRSFAVSLGQKRNAMAQCLDRLNALQDAFQEGVTFKATR